MTSPLVGFELLCPACQGALDESADRFRCRSCDRGFPILFGIPDFRLTGDLYLDLADERAKARRLHEFAQSHSFAELVAFYYRITDDVPQSLTSKFSAYVIDAPARMRLVLEALAPPRGEDYLLDLGCGAGGALVAGEGYAGRVGVDIALRWLVICQKRLEELGIAAHLICADVEALPFERGRFSRVLANDLIEHARNPRHVVAGCAGQVAPCGQLYLSASNRRWVGPHPAVGIWAAGLMPGPIRSFVAQRLRGVDVLRHARFVSAAQVTRWLGDAGMRMIEVGPKQIGKPDPTLSRARAALVGAYRRATRMPRLRRAMAAAGPAFEIIASKSSREGMRCVLD